VAVSVGELSGAWNFRDVAEATGVRQGRFFRSSELSRLDDGGRDHIRRLGITDVADLRSPREVERRGPGQVPDGVAVHLLPFPDVSAVDGEAPHEATFQKMMSEKPDDEDVAVAGVRFMTEEYLRFPTLGGAQRAVRQVISLLAAQRPVITHCFAGKDRTGFTVATVLEAIGVDRDAILTDFLRSNDAVRQLRARILESVRDKSETAEVLTFAEARLTDELLGVREDYLDAARRSIAQNYGSLRGYLEVSGVTAEDVDFVETYDDYPVICMMQIEDLGFCAKGEGPEFIRRHSFEANGSFPFNTSGGQLSVGQAGAAGGTLGLVEAIRQVTGQAIGVQVENARHALVSGYGMINFDRGLCSGAAILAAT